jgi:hypothetical protein
MQILMHEECPDSIQWILTYFNQILLYIFFDEKLYV